MNYSELVSELNGLSEEEFRIFQTRMVNSKGQTILGVRTPVLRKLVKKYKDNVEELLRFPDEYYEVTFIKLNVLALQPYPVFLSHVEECVASIDNWAICDTFKGKYIKKNEKEFLPYVQKFLSGGEFFQRYALVTLLSFYCKEEYLPVIFDSMERADKELFYVHMAVAWLMAEVLVKCYTQGLDYLKENKLPQKTHNKAIQKAKESFRLTGEQKEELSSLVRK